MDLAKLDMPPVLANMFKHLLNTYGHIRGWNIYENDRGFINLNIRFNSIVCENSDNISHARLEPVKYKRLSSQQSARNRNRAQTYKSLHTTTTNKIKEDHTIDSVIKVGHTVSSNECTEDHTNSLVITKKRKCEDNSPEILRSEPSETASNENYLDSPEIISKSDHSIIGNLHPSPPILTEDIEVIDTQSSTSVCESPLMDNPDYVDSPAITPPSINLETIFPSISCLPNSTPSINLLEQDSIVDFTSATSMELLSSKTTNLQEPVLCPCCSENMTVEHVCESGDDPSDALNSEYSTPSSPTKPSPTPSPLPQLASPTPFPSPQSTSVDPTNWLVSFEIAKRNFKLLGEKIGENIRFPPP